MTDTCGCCEGTESRTPAPIANRPGLETLTRRIGRHSDFYESMKARLSNLPWPGGPSPLRRLTTRVSGDPSIALLDAWSTVADVMTFYQERIANEGYLRTATERRSIVELSRLIGYQPRPGVAASVHLAFTLEQDTGEIIIPAGTGAKSIPGQDELPQTFETSEDLKARPEWNELRPRMSRPQNLNRNTERIYFTGTATNLQINDLLLIDSGGDTPLARFVKSVEPDFDADRTTVTLQADPFSTVLFSRQTVAEISAYRTATRSATPKPTTDTDIESILDDLEGKLNGATLVEMDAAAHEALTNLRASATTIGNTATGFDQLSTSLTEIAVDDEPADISPLEEKLTQIETRIRTVTIGAVVSAQVKSLLEILKETFLALNQLSAALGDPANFTFPQLKEEVTTTVDTGRPSGTPTATRSLKELAIAADGLSGTQLKDAVDGVVQALETLRDAAPASGTDPEKNAFIADVRAAANNLNPGDMKSTLDLLLTAVAAASTIAELQEARRVALEEGRSLTALRDEAVRGGATAVSNEIDALISGLSAINGSLPVEDFSKAIVAEVAQHSPTSVGHEAVADSIDQIDDLGGVATSDPLSKLAQHVQAYHHDLQVSTGHTDITAQFTAVSAALQAVVVEADKSTDNTLADLLERTVPSAAPGNSDQFLRENVPLIRGPLLALVPDPPLSLSRLVSKSRETAADLGRLTTTIRGLKSLFDLYREALGRLVSGLETIITRVRSVFASEIGDVETRYAFLTSFTGAAREPATAAHGVLVALVETLPAAADLKDTQLQSLVDSVKHHIGPGDSIEARDQHVVADIAARDALTGVESGAVAFVTDATSDPSVTSGGAVYQFDGTTWARIAVDPNLEKILKGVQAQGSALAVLATRLQTLIRELEELNSRVTVVDGPGTPLDPEPALAIQRLLGLRGALALRQTSQPRGRAELSRELSEIFELESDVLPQLLQVFDPAISSDLYRAWRNARVELPAPKVYALRARAAVFGYNAPPEITVTRDNVTKTEWTPADDEAADKIYLDNEYSGVIPGSFLAVQTPNRSQPIAFSVADVLLQPRTAYSISGKSTDITIERNSGSGWWNPEGGDGFDYIRGTTVYAESELLPLAEEPIFRSPGQPRSSTASFDPSANSGSNPDVDTATELEEAANEIELDTLYDGLEVGRSFFITGQRVDLAGVTGTELAVLAGVKQVLRSDLPGDTPHTRLVFANDLTFRYERETTKLHANVIGATHGQTQSEILGSGDATASFQQFTLSSGPLTFLSAPTRSGSESTLTVRVGGIRWLEAQEFATQSSTDRVFVTATDNEQQSTVTFGNGTFGTRLPTGVENVSAEYRVGIGAAGNVQAEQISQLADRSLGLKEVINPQKASGGAEAESRDRIRENAPLAVVALDRLVSIQDYADLARTFAGVGKASAVRLTDGSRELTHVTIAGGNDVPVSPDSDLFRNLQQTLATAGAGSAPVALSVRELGLLIIDAGVHVLPDYEWQNVEIDVRSALLNTFSFHRRSLGQDVTLSEVVSTIQGVTGVSYVDVNVLHAVNESITPDQLDRLAENLRTREDQPVKRLTAALAGTKTHIVRSNDENTLAKIATLYLPRTSLDDLLRLNPGVTAEAPLPINEKVVVSRTWPAQIIYLSPAVPDTLLLSEIR